MQTIKTNVPSTKPSLLAMAASMSNPTSEVMKAASEESAMQTNTNTDAPKGLLRQPGMTGDQMKKLAKDTAAKLKANGDRPATTKLGDGKSTKAAATAKAASKPKADKAPKQPKGLVVDCLKLSSRANGADRDELAKETKWHGTPWKWMFFNSKGNGWCQRWGYDLRVFTGADGETRYQTTKTTGTPKMTVEAAPKAPKVAKAKSAAKTPVKAKARSAGKGKGTSKSKARPSRAKGKRRAA